MKFRNIIILMLLTMIGLITFQWYWIENAISVKKEQFDRNVTDALQETIKKIEKQEIIFLANQKMKIEEQKKLMAMTQQKHAKRRVVKPVAWREVEPTDIYVSSEPPPAKEDSRTYYTAQSPDNPRFNRRGRVVAIAPSDVFGAEPILEIPDRQMDLIKEMLEEQNIMWEELNQPVKSILMRQKTAEDLMQEINRQLGVLHQNNLARNRNVLRLRTDEKNGIYTYNYVTGFQPTDSISIISVKPSKAKVEKKVQVDKQEDKVETSYERTQNKVELVKNVLTDVIHGNRNIHERLDRLTLDTLLKKELKYRGITIPYQYGVKSNSNMIFSSFTENYGAELLQNAYKALLFPSDLQSQNHYLYVYFPSTQGFILRNMWTVFASSIVLILMIGGIFYTSVNTMLKQKKLADIKNDFINNMTHEFKTPISTISLAVEVMKDNEVKKDNGKMNRYLNIIQDENRRLGTQVEKVLQMALLDKGEVKLKLEPVNIHETIEQVLNNLSVQIEQKNGVVNLELEAEKPEIEADEVHLTNIIYNLLDNANKYSFESPDITIRTENVDDSLKITVADKGIGMNKDQTNRVFERFYRVPTGNLHDVKGFGLGLSYVKKMVESHNGQVQVESKLGEGSRFEVILPRSMRA